MPLTGELEHLPIVDVIQLIHSTRKSGTLNVYSHNGEGQLVFNNGYIIGATHSSEKIKVGQILLANQAISQQCLDKALEIQEISGENRKPVIAILLDNCGVSKEAAFKALETLIEMTVVEMISWVKGVFTLDVNEVNVSDDYRYLPEQLQAISLDTQMVLLDALRIYDEKVHSGEIQISDEPLQENPLEQFEKIAAPEPETTADGIEVSEDLLGLADLDKVERKKPYVFKVLEVFDPADIHRQVIDKAIPHIKEMEKEKLVNFLSGISSLPRAEDNSPLMAVAKSQAVIIFTGDEFLQHAIMTVCKKEGILVFATADRDNLDNLINQARLKQIEPILIFGQPLANNEVFSQAQLVDIRAQKITQYPQIAIIQLASPVDYNFSP
ncbi:MAG: DUF4388 domain-containing protein, partial [Desulfuromonadales bacterium]|nr:DUF4388 domain-containing protein [Desulfuromonadales bacterium]